MSLRNQLFAVLSVLFFAVLSVILVVSVTGTREFLERQLASHAQDAATALSVSLGQSLGKSDIVLAQTQVLSVFDRGYFRRIAVLAPDRSAILSSELPRKIEGVPMWFVDLVPIKAMAGEAFVGSGWKQLGKVLVVSQPTFAYQHLWQTSTQTLAWLLAIYVVALALVRVGLVFILKPLRAIEKTARDVQAKRFLPIKLRPFAPELARVVAAMNQMSQRVGEMLDAETAKAEALRKQAYEDDMTGLANRLGYEMRLAELLRGEPLLTLGAVVSVEIDDIRPMSRMHGFASVVHIMRVVADSARSVFAPVPVSILARSNEFSFSFVLADTAPEQVLELATELRRRIMAQLLDFAPSQMVRINIGAAFFHQDDNRSDVFARVDLAVESARQSARNGLVVLPDQAQKHTSLGSAAWRTLIQTALSEGRWRLLRQPVVSLAAPQTVLQIECMARLFDSRADLVPAANFLPMAARHGLMPEVDRAIVNLALKLLKQSTRIQPPLAINLSPQSIAEPRFMAWFAERLASLRDDAGQLAVEVSEFGALRNWGPVMELRDLVRRHGYKFGIDHFGLDPKSVQLLREMAPDYVKLTGSLSAEVVTLVPVREMLQSFVKLAHSLDVMVMALQIENAEQVTMLATAGVDAGQGYYFGAPQPMI